MAETPNSDPVSTRRQRIAELATNAPQMAFTSLNHHIDLAWLHEAYRRTRKDAAVGVDGQTAAEFEANLQDNLQSLLDRAKSGTYHAPPVRRVHIPKGTKGETRPIGIPTLADKVLQRAVVMALEPIYEQDFYDCSYGFRPGRSAHQALETLWQRLMRMGGGWVLEVDIQKFFDTMDRGHLRAMVAERVRDGVIRRLIGKWMNAGVLEGGQLSRAETGAPQGGVISPMLANVYLHVVLDRWFHEQVEPRLRGSASLIRFADDFVMVFQHEVDARRVEEVLPKRFAKYGLTIHPQKTRLVKFKRPRDSDRAKRGERPDTFDLLGFTHHWGRSRGGRWVVKRRTCAARLARALRRTAQWCRMNRHRPVRDQHAMLCRKLRGHYAYYGITGNSVALSRYRFHVLLVWWKWLRRRNRNGSRLTWDRYRSLLRRFPLPQVVTVHSTLRHAAKP